MYTELHTHSCFSLLDGASTPGRLVETARALGYRALALTDHNEMGGAVQFAEAAREAGLGGILGTELTVLWKDELTHLTLLAESQEGYANLCQLITKSRMEMPRGEPAVTLEHLAQHAPGIFALTGCLRGRVPALVARGEEAAARAAAGQLMEMFGRRLAIECWDHGLEEERVVFPALRRIARSLDVPWVVTNDVHYAHPDEWRTHDVLTALRHRQTLEEMGSRLRPSGEWYLKHPAQQARRWQHDMDGLRASVEIAERCAFRLEQLTPAMPDFPLPPGVTADEYLARLVAQGARERWGHAITDAHRRQLVHELAMIKRLDFAGYFLIVWDIVRFARREGILCQGRGSAANSAVCYCLGITAIDPVAMELLFERFLSDDRREAPDIDLDFAHQERERVIQYVYQRYGRDHAAMVCEQITWRGRSAIRDAARVLGYSAEEGEAMAEMGLDGQDGRDGQETHSAQRTALSVDHRGLPPRPAPPSLHSCGRVCAHSRAAGHRGPDRARLHAGAHRDPVGKG